MADWEDKLKSYESDKEAAKDEILRAKTVYEKEKAAGAGQDRLDQIHKWADQVRSSSGISDGDKTYGNNNGVDPETQKQITKDTINSRKNKSSVTSSASGGINTGGIDANRNAGMDALSARKAGLYSQLESEYNAKFKSNKAQLDSAKANQIAALQKAYQDAVTQGSLSVREAETAFQEQVKSIEQQSYQDAEETKIYSAQQGIQNSNQALGLQASDNARSMTLKNQNQTTRDKRVADIADRIKNLTNQRDLDVANTNQQYDLTVAQLRADRDSNLANQKFSLDRDDYVNERDYLNQVSLMDRSNVFDLQKMDLANKYDLNKMSVANGYDLNKMSVNQSYTQDNMKLAQSFDLEKLSAQQKNTLEQMATAYGYDLGKMDKNQQYQLDQMAKAYGYDMQKMSVAQGYDMQKIGAQNSAAMQQLQARYAMESKQVEDEYNVAVQRELAKYTPGTPEHYIAKQALEADKQSKLSDLQAKLQFEAQTSSVLKNPNLDVTGNIKLPQKDWWQKITGQGLSEAQVNEYNAKLQAYQRYAEMMGADPSSIPSGSNLEADTDGAKFGGAANDWIKQLLGKIIVDNARKIQEGK